MSVSRQWTDGGNQMSRRREGSERSVEEEEEEEDSGSHDPHKKPRARDPHSVVEK